MIRSNGHIIAKCRWDTLFDKKEMGAALQGRLSSWSRLKMPGEMEDIFDKICPPGQVWKIQSLEIDLGQISCNELESELLLNLRKQLSKKLTDLVLYRDEGGNAVEIIDENTSHIDLIRHFLLHGLIPWSYKDLDTSINYILANQLQNDRQRVIAMLREIGITHENVRKRIAWQISEANIIKIIEGLEPNNAQQVIDFSTELTTIQAKESIVQTGMPDFKKNVWFWILNYLLAERGSVFNQVAFMRSNLSQMAAHYHISYDELIGIIGRAVDRVTENNVIKDEIILTFRILADENRVPGIENQEIRKSTDIDFALENYFSAQVTPGQHYSIAELNDMVLSIADGKGLNFRQLLLSFSDRENRLMDKVSGLNERALEAIYSSLNNDSSVISKAYIHYLAGLSGALKAEQRFLWEAAIKFAIGNKGISFTRKKFLDQMAAELAKKNHISKAAVLEQLICADVPAGTKTLLSLAVYTDLTEVFAAEISGDNGTVMIPRFKQLLDVLGHQILKGDIESSIFISLQEPLVQYIRLNPAAAFNALAEYRNKRNLQKLLPYLLDEPLTNLLIRNAKNEAAEILLSIIEAFHKASTSIPVLMEGALADMGLELLLCEPGSNARQYVERLLEKITQSVPTHRSGQFFELLYEWDGNNKLLGKIIPAEILTGLKQRLSPAQKQPLLQQVAVLMRKAGNEAAVAGLLSVNFGEDHFAKLRGPGTRESATILNYLLKGAANLMDTLVKEYMSLLKSKPVRLSETRIPALLKDLYWKCILDHSYHRGSVSAFRKLFEAAVYSTFNLFNENTGEWAGTQGVQLPNGQKITLSELIAAVKQGITDGSETINIHGLDIRVSELLVSALEVKPEELLRIIKDIAVSEKRIEALSKAVPFNQFCLLTANAAGGNMNDAINSVQMLYALSDRITSGRITEKLLYSYWRAIWTIIRTCTLKTAYLKSLVAESMYQLAVEKQVNSDLIISGISKLPFRLNATLKTAFASYNPAFAALPALETPGISRELKEIKQKGLLYSLSYHIITRKQVPLWFFNADEQKTGDILNELVVHHPVNLLLVLKQEVVSERQMMWLHDTINFSTLINSIAVLHQDRQMLLNDLEQLYKLVEKVSIAGGAARGMRYLLFRKLLSAWTTNNWASISGERLWNELIWDICVKKGASKKQLMYDVEKTVSLLPLSLQIGFRHLKEQEKTTVIAKPAIAKPVKRVLQTGPAASPAKEGIVVKNAGLVLVNNYVPALFERLGLIHNKTFIHAEARERAVHYLQYVVTGLNSTEEYLLPLNKLMCGLPFVYPVDYGIEIAEEHHNIIEGLVKAMIAHWPSIGDTSVYGFRGNWLVRDGVLTELDDKWELAVEKRAYDILLNRAPFSFSIIKYPWMDKPIHVSWSY